MSLRDDFLEDLAPTFTWRPVTDGLYVITERSGVPLRGAVTLHLDELLFDRYVRWLARKVDDGSISDALGTVWFALDEDMSSTLPPSYVTDVGLRRGFLGRPRWFSLHTPTDRVPNAVKDPNLRWVANPPH